MSTAEANASSGLKTQIENLISEWDLQVSEFRRLSLAGEGYTEVTRMRAKADTLAHSRNELANILNALESEKEKEQESLTWPGLRGILQA
jgi:hypothetical protein